MIETLLLLVKTALFLGAVFVTPGLAALVRLGKAPLWERLTEAVCLSMLSTSLVAIVTLQLEVFDLWTVVGGTHALAMLSILHQRSRRSLAIPEVRLPDWRRCVLLLLVVGIAFFLRWPPYNYFIGNNDPGSYVVGGALLARTGSIKSTALLVRPELADITWSTAPMVAAEALPPALEGEDHLEDWYEGLWSPAYFVQDAETGLVIPQFLHLWMVWIGLSIDVYGPGGAAWLLPIFGLVGAMLLARATAIIWGEAAGWVALALVCLNWSFAYFSRITVSEGCTFAFAALALYALARASDSEDAPRYWALLSAAGWAATLLSRLVLLYQAPAWLVWLGLLALVGARGFPVAWHAVGCFVFCGLAFAHNLLFSFPYTYTQLWYAGLAKAFRWEVPVLLGVAAVGGFAAWLLRRPIAQGLSRMQAFRGVSAPAIAVLSGLVLAGTVVYALLPGYPFVFFRGETIDWRTNEIFLRFAVPVGMPCLLLSIVGLTWGLWEQRKAPHPGALFFLAFMFTVWLVHGTIRASWLVAPYGLRYYATDLSPMVMVFAAVAITRSCALLPWAKLPAVAMAVAVMGASVPSLRGHQFMLDYKAHRSTAADIIAFGDLVPPGSVLLFDRTAPIRAFMTMLHAHYGIEGSTIQRQHLPQVMAFLGDTERQVFLLSWRPVPEEEVAAYGLDEIGALQVTINEISQDRTHRHISWRDHLSAVPARVYRVALQERSKPSQEASPSE